jgi:hypothetical protein
MGSISTAAAAASPTSGSFTSLSTPGDGDDPGRDGQEVVERTEVTPPPSTAERQAFKLLPLAWVGVLVLAVVILYLVFR